MPETHQIQIPGHMLKGLLGGPQPAQKPPDVIEVVNEDGRRLAFNADSIELVYELVYEGGAEHPGCCLKLKNCSELVGITMPYDAFLKAIDVKPRVLTDDSRPQTDSGN